MTEFAREKEGGRDSERERECGVGQANENSFNFCEDGSKRSMRYERLRVIADGFSRGLPKYVYVT